MNPIKKHGFKFGIGLMALIFSSTGRAEDTLTALMQRMQSDTAVKIAYSETRTLELMESPWLGSGYMYSLPPDLMIREQLLPERVLMAVKGEQMFYYDPSENVRRQGEMDYDSPLTLNLTVFKALINADENLLHKVYRVDFASREQGWIMTLKPKQSKESGFSIVISGPAGQQANRIEVKQPDGDSSEFALHKDAEGVEVEAEVNRLYLELQGR